MEKFVIKGGPPLSGEITAAGNKNAALPILAACLLTEEELVLTNVPRIRDTETQVAVLEGLGVSAVWSAHNELRLRANGVTDTSPDEMLSARIRASFLLAGPLLARFGEAHMPPPGGDFIGRRRIDPHLDAFKDLGARVEGGRQIDVVAPEGGLRPCSIFMDEPSVMGTENALLAAALTPGPTTIANAASEPHVQDLARLLVKMGAQIDGIGSNVMTVHGRDKLAGAEHRICPDHIEVASFMALAAATKGELRIRNTQPDDLLTIRRHFRRLGLQSMVEGEDILVPPEQALEVRDDRGDAIPKIDDGPWPAFPADLTSIALALATQARGTILIFEKMFENRLFFVDKLVAMGARITLCDPHRAIVSGPSRLHGERVESPDIRAGPRVRSQRGPQSIPRRARRKRTRSGAFRRSCSRKRTQSGAFRWSYSYDPSHPPGNPGHPPR
jgi:UDP-N-acetylglucosamine 1-carboxyvinyltransferase